MSSEVGNLLAKWPTITGLVIVTVLAFLIWLVVKASREGREVSLWPPRIGPRESTLAKSPRLVVRTGRSLGMSITDRDEEDDEPSDDESEDVATTLIGVDEEELHDVRFDDTAGAPKGRRCASAKLLSTPVAALFVESGGSYSRFFIITPMDWKVTVGRFPSCQICLPKDPHLSRLQFTIEIDRNLEASGQAYRFTITAQSFKIPTVVNGEKVQAKELTHHDVIEAGNVRLKFFVL